MDNSFKNFDFEKIYRNLITIYAEQEGFKIVNIILEKKEELNA